MKTPSKFLMCIFIAALSAPLCAFAFPGESIVLDPVSGNYTITYWNESMEPPGLETTTFVPATKIIPTIQSVFSLDRTWKITYRYAIANGAQSKQVLGNIIFDLLSPIIGTRDDSKMGLSAAAMAVLKANKEALFTPAGWDGSVAFGLHGDNSVRIAWRDSVEFSTGLNPGSTLRGLGFLSYALPGVDIAQMEGDSPVHGWSGEGPGPDSAIIQQLQQIEEDDHVSRNAAVPTIAVPVPFNAATLLGSIQTHVHTWIGMKLLDATFSSQLDIYFQAAIDAYGRNQPKAGKEHIEALRKMIKPKHEEFYKADEKDHDKADEKDRDEDAYKRAMIDHLAARILDFDLEYVLKRAGGDKD